jgi:hypothetical protein
MTKITWDGHGDKKYENGVDHGVLYRRNSSGVYDAGYAWNGLTTVTESPSGAESNKKYADNIVYANLISAEMLDATIEAFTYPDEFAECDGSAELAPGVTIGQQTRQPFGLSYRTLVGSDANPELGYKLHLLYGANAAPTEKAFASVNDSPENITFSWSVSTTPIDVAGKKPTSLLVVDSTKVSPSNLAALEAILYGTPGTDPRLPLPLEVAAIFAGTLTEAVPVMPAYNSSTHVITIPSVTGLVYKIDGDVVTGAVTITADTIVTVEAAAGYKLPAVTDEDWLYDYV